MAFTVVQAMLATNTKSAFIASAVLTAHFAIAYVIFNCLLSVSCSSHFTFSL
jgi:hypothetical protein